MGCSLRLQRFCCCCSLRTGTLVIGTLGWLNTLSQIFITPGSMHLNNHKYGHADKNEVIDNSLFARIGVCVISLLVSVLLIVGVYKKNNKFMLPWLVLQCLGCVAISIIALICFGATFMVPSQHIAVFIAITVALILMGSLACILLLIIPISSFVFVPVANILFAQAFADFPSDIKQFETFSAKIEALIFIPRIIYTVLNVLAVITLIIGACKNNHKLLLPWLIFHTITCIGGSVSSVTVLVYILCIMCHFTLKLMFVIVFFIVLLITALWWYFLLCVWSYYKELQEGSLQKSKQSAV
ncbi:hypothetical protein CBL_01157 [Carabus blaptoides fortunei]